MDLIDRIYRDVKNHRNLVRYYTNRNIGVSYLRAKEKNDTRRVLDLYGTDTTRGACSTCTEPITKDTGSHDGRRYIRQPA